MEKILGNNCFFVVSEGNIFNTFSIFLIFMIMLNFLIIGFGARFGLSPLPTLNIGKS